MLVVVDLFLKPTVLVPPKKLPTAPQTAAHWSLQYVFYCHGLPDHMVTDQGDQFTAQFWKKFIGLLRVQLPLLSPYHLQLNGQIEQVNCFICHQVD